MTVRGLVIQVLHHTSPIERKLERSMGLFVLEPYFRFSREKPVQGKLVLILSIRR